MRSTSTAVEEEDVVVVLTAQEFASLATQSFICDYTNRILRTLKKKNLTLIVYGLVAYLKYELIAGLDILTQI